MGKYIITAQNNPLGGGVIRNSHRIRSFRQGSRQTGSC